MRIRQSKAYLILSSCQLGMSDHVLNIFRNVAKTYSAEVIHLGPTATDEEIRNYKKMSTAEEKVNFALKIEDNEKKIETLDNRRDEIATQLEFLRKAERDRILKLVKTFEDVTFVTNDMITLHNKRAAFRGTGAKFVWEGLELSRLLFLSPVPMKGIKSTRNPINAQVVEYLKKKGKNWIVAHPVPSVECFPKVGLNQSYNYWTVGSLVDVDDPKKHTEMYKFDHLPCAILVLVDTATGEFHPRQVHIETYINHQNQRTYHFACDDGLVFTENSVMEVGSQDKATLSTDDHAPDHHPGVLAAIRGLNVLHKPGTYINNGDAGDFPSVNRHTEDRPAEREGHRLSKDLADLRKLLDAQTNVSSIKEKILIDSNHHEWISFFVAQHPNLIGLVDWPSLASTIFKDWRVYLRDEGEAEGVFFFGDLMIRHGDQDGGAKRAERLSPSGKYLCGHFHKMIAYRRSMQIGCGCTLSPKYTGTQIKAWQNHVAVLTKYRGMTATSPKIVLHDKTGKFSRFSYRGKVYEVPICEI